MIMSKLAIIGCYSYPILSDTGEGVAGGSPRLV